MSKECEPPNFKTDDGRIFLVRCPKCGRENWAPAVASGICSWCEYNANGDDSGPKENEKNDR